jgi:hypothetical protein
MTRRIKISLLALISFILSSCSLNLTESHYGEYSSYEKFESKCKVKNKEGLELGEERIPRIKKQIYHVRLNDSSVLDLKWVSRRPVIGNRYHSHIDSVLRVEYISGLKPINDSIIGTYQFGDFENKQIKKNISTGDTSDNWVIDFLRNSPDFDKQNGRSKRKIQILGNGRCTYANYVPGGPDSGGGRHLKFSGNILFEGDTITAILYRDVLYKIPIRPFEIKLVKNRSNDTLQSVIDGEISSQYGYIRIE